MKSVANAVIFRLNGTVFQVPPASCAISPKWDICALQTALLTLVAWLDMRMCEEVAAQSAEGVACKRLQRASVCSASVHRVQSEGTENTPTL